MAPEDLALLKFLRDDVGVKKHTLSALRAHAKKKGALRKQVLSLGLVSEEDLALASLTPVPQPKRRKGRKKSSAKPRQARKSEPIEEHPTLPPPTPQADMPVLPPLPRPSVELAANRRAAPPAQVAPGTLPPLPPLMTPGQLPRLPEVTPAPVKRTQPDARPVPVEAPFASEPISNPSPAIATRVGDPLAEAEARDAEEVAELDRRKRDVLPELADGAGRFTLGEEVARGGMGRIVEAQDANIGRTVAMKLLIGGRKEQLGLQLRFTEEAQITGQLEHPNIVPVYDLGTHEDGQLYFTMKRVRGRTLRDILKDLRRGDTGIAESYGRGRLLSALKGVCMGIAYAHSQGVVHRDLKPSNIMLGDYGEVLVMDWGLAKIIKRADGTGVQSHREGMTRWATQHGEVIGTPGYMPPELALGQLDDVDERSDVYSLGAILYEVLTLRPPYVGRDSRTILRKMLRERVVPPRERAPDRDIPPALEEICMRCLAKAPEQRYPDVLALHRDIETFLEGALERERQHARAAGLIAEGQRLTDAYWSTVKQVEKIEAEVEGHELLLAPWDGAEQRRPLWRATENLDSARRDRVEALARAVEAFRQALSAVPDSEAARGALAELYSAAFLSAEREGDEGGQLHYETLLRSVDDGRYDQMLAGDGRLVVESDPPGAQAVLFTYREIDRVLTADEPQHLGTTPVTIDPLPMGSYLVVLRAPGLRDAQLPVAVSRQAEQRVRARLRGDVALGPGMVYIPGGTYSIGGDGRASWSLPGQEIQLQDFCLARLPVSCRQYLDFLNDLAASDLDQARRRSPRLFVGGGALFEEREGRFHIPTVNPSGLPWDHNWPVFGVSYHDAEAYCAWRGARDRVPYRLPTEMEWEAAARGNDGRFYTWGNSWEPTYCKCAQARPGPPALEPCGSYPKDRSPFGVMDMAGGVADWTVSQPMGQGGGARDERICRGGSWRQLDLNARAASRQAAAPESVSVAVGFRLARSL